MVLKLRLGVPLVVVTCKGYRENDGVLVKLCCLIWSTVIRGEFSSWTFIDLHFYGIWLFSVYITLQQPCFWSIPLRRLIMSWAQLGAARRGTGTHSEITECLERHVSGSSGGYLFWVLFFSPQSESIDSRSTSCRNCTRPSQSAPNAPGQAVPRGMFSRAPVGSVFTHSVDKILKAQDTKKLHVNDNFSKCFISYSFFSHFAYSWAYPKGMWTLFYRAFTVCHRAQSLDMRKE